MVALLDRMSSHSLPGPVVPTGPLVGATARPR
jgi:hypothetical protein